MESVDAIVIEIIKEPYQLENGRWEIIIKAQINETIRDEKFNRPLKQEVDLITIGYKYKTLL